MNKLKTDINAAGFPFVLDDLRWIDDGLRDAFKSIFAAYGEQFIISGCELTWNPISLTWSCTEGYIYFDGEILYCPGGTAVQDETHTAVFDLEVIYDINGNKQFGNSEFHNTYEIRRAKFYAVDPNETTGKLIATTAKRLHEVIANSIADNVEDWQYPTLAGDWDTEDNVDFSRVKYKKDLFGQVRLAGQAINGSGYLFTLPTGYKPARPLYFYSIWPEPGDHHFPMTIQIGTDGLVNVLETEIELVNLDGISF